MELTVAAPSRRALVLKVLLVALTATAWVHVCQGLFDALTAPPDVAGAHHHDHAARWSPLTFWGTVSMWMAMLVAMMVPAVFPWVMALLRLDRGRLGHGALPGRHRLVTVAAFLAGYFTVWLAFATGATLLQWSLSVNGVLTPSLILDNNLARGVAFLVIGAYQWSPLKDACLTRCESPFTFFLSRWRDGPPGALVMGMHHGLHCIGCCWLLMLGMVGIGAMSVSWMVGVTLFMLMEMYVPELRWASRAVGAVLIPAGLASIAAAVS